MVDYNDNDKKKTDSEEPKESEDGKVHLEPVVHKGEVIHMKKGLGAKFREVFFNGDLTAAGRYVLLEVATPALKNLIVDFMHEGTKRVVFGDSGYPYRHRPSDDYRRSRIDYSDFRGDPRRSDRGLPTTPDQPRSRARGALPTNIILQSKTDAELVLERMTDVLSEYNYVTVGHLNELLGEPPSYTDNKFGWESLAGASVRLKREGYLLDLPPAREL